jgi:Zn-dependent peptidase ImmA (M78 family)
MTTSFYTPELTEELKTLWGDGSTTTVDQLAEKYQVSKRSIIAKLSSLGLYSKRPYLNKRGELPIKKEEYVEMLAKTLDVPIDRLESLEKVNKSVLKLLLDTLNEKSPEA